MTETNRIEYKQELTEGLEKEVIAFLNYREGGIIYIGIDKAGNTCGLADSDSDQLKIKDRLKNNIKPSALGLFDIVSEERDGKGIIKIIVASGPEKPYHIRKYGMSEKGCFIRVAKYSGTNRTDLIESNEYGNECLAKATKQVIDKIAVENRIATKITSKERKQSHLWNPIALREAIINAFVHNDYTNEVPPKFEIFSDRIEITSAGGLPEGLSQQEFFEGFSVPRNKELMRIFKDLELVEQLGFGIPRILDHYGKESFNFSENFLRMTFITKELTTKVDNKVDNEEGGQIGGQIGGQVSGQVSGVIDEDVNKEIDALQELTLRQKEILKMIASDNRISRSGIAEVLHINESSIQKHLNHLKEKEYLERIGGTRGYWKVNIGN